MRSQGLGAFYFISFRIITFISFFSFFYLRHSPHPPIYIRSKRKHEAHVASENQISFDFPQKSAIKRFPSASSAETTEWFGRFSFATKYSYSRRRIRVAASYRSKASEFRFNYLLHKNRDPKIHTPHFKSVTST